MRFLILNKLNIYLNKIIKQITNYRIQFTIASRLPEKYKKVISNNIKFKDCHKNTTAYIIASGPSLKNQNLLNLEGELIFCVNSFFKHEHIKKLNPRYVFFLDPNLFNLTTIKKSDFYTNAKKMYNNSIFFLPLFRGYRSVIKNQILPIDKCQFVALGGVDGCDINIDTVIPNFHGVGAFALATAVYMGCSPIYLLGFDHDYLANRGVNHHFYEGSTVDIPNFTEPLLGERVPYDEEMITNYNLWQNYRSILKIAKRKNIKIYNATKGGYLDIFEFANLDYL